MNKVEQVHRILNFLNYTLSFEKIEQKINQDFQLFFRRQHKSRNIEHYTASQKRKINSVILKAAKFLKDYDRDNIFRLETYLTTV